MREAAVLAMADEEVSGLVRIALPENLADFVVAPRVEALLERFPGLQLALDSNIAFADLTRLGADIALRFSPPESGDVLTRRIGTTRFGVYGHRELVQRFAGAALEDLPWIGWHAPLAGLPEARWLSKVVGATPGWAAAKRRPLCRWSAIAPVSRCFRTDLRRFSKSSASSRPKV
ncbi:MAG: LysR substrate-binding domain-containing protein [bacterium]